MPYSVTISDTPAFDSASFGKEFERYLTYDKAKIGADLYDEAFKGAFSDEQRKMMGENGLDEFDMIFIDGKSARDHFGFKGETQTANPPYTEQALKATVIGALSAGNKRVEFCNVKKDGNRLDITPPTPVETTIINDKSKQPKLSLTGWIRKLFGLPNPGVPKTNAEMAKELSKENEEVRKARHSNITESAKARAKEAKALYDTQKPFKRAYDEYEKVKAHNTPLYCMGEDGKMIDHTLLNKWDSALGFDSRLPSRVAEMNLYMMHRGMTLDQICSADPMYDEQKKQFAQDYNKMVKEAAEKVIQAQNKARENAGAGFDEKNREKHAQDCKTCEAMARENAGREYDEKVKANPEANMGKTRDEVCDEAAKKALDDLNAEIKRKRDAICTDAAFNAGKDVIKNSPEVAKIRDTYLDMGDKMLTVKTPANGFDFKPQTPEEYAKTSAVKDLAFNNHSFFSAIKLDFSPEQAARFEKQSSAEAVMSCGYVPYSHVIDQIASDGFVRPEKARVSDYVLCVNQMKMIPVVNDIIKGSETFGDVGDSVAQRIYSREERDWENGKAVKKTVTYTGKDALLKEYGDITDGIAAVPKGSEIAGLNKSLQQQTKDDVSGEIAPPPKNFVIEEPSKEITLEVKKEKAMGNR